MHGRKNVFKQQAYIQSIMYLIETNILVAIQLLSNSNVNTIVKYTLVRTLMLINYQNPKSLILVNNQNPKSLNWDLDAFSLSFFFLIDSNKCFQ